jgi:hypothetical protein
VPRAVALIVGFAQATYSFAPAAFGAMLAGTTGAAASLADGASGFFIVAAGLQVAAIAWLIVGVGSGDAGRHLGAYLARQVRPSHRSQTMNSIIYLVGLVVVVVIILSFLGLW